MCIRDSLRTGKPKEMYDNNKRKRKRKRNTKAIDPYVRRFIEKCNAITKSDWTKCLLPLLQVDLGVISTLGLIDSGSTRTLMSQRLADKLFEHNLVKRSQAVNIKCATANKQNIVIKLSITIKRCV